MTDLIDSKSPGTSPVESRRKPNLFDTIARVVAGAGLAALAFGGFTEKATEIKAPFLVAGTLPDDDGGSLQLRALVTKLACWDDEPGKTRITVTVDMVVQSTDDDAARGSPDKNLQ